MKYYEDLIDKITNKKMSPVDFPVPDLELFSKDYIEYFVDKYLTGESSLVVGIFIDFLYKMDKDNDVHLHKLKLWENLFEYEELQHFIRNDGVSGHIYPKNVDVSRKWHGRFFEKMKQKRREKYRNVVNPLIKNAALTIDQFKQFQPIFNNIFKSIYYMHYHDLINEKYLNDDVALAKAIDNAWFTKYLLKIYKDDKETTSMIHDCHNSLESILKGPLPKRSYKDERIQAGKD